MYDLISIFVLDKRLRVLNKFYKQQYENNFKVTIKDYNYFEFVNEFKYAKLIYCKSNIEPLANLINLRLLWLSYIGITNIEPLMGLTNLQELRLTYT